MLIINQTDIKHIYSVIWKCNRLYFRQLTPELLTFLMTKKRAKKIVIVDALIESTVKHHHQNNQLIIRKEKKEERSPSWLQLTNTVMKQISRSAETMRYIHETKKKNRTGNKKRLIPLSNMAMETDSIMNSATSQNIYAYNLAAFAIGLRSSKHSKENSNKLRSAWRNKCKCFVNLTLWNWTIFSHMGQVHLFKSCW